MPSIWLFIEFFGLNLRKEDLWTLVYQTFVPHTFVPWTFVPRTFVPWNFVPLDFCSLKFCSQNFCSLEFYCLDFCSLDFCFLEFYTLDFCTPNFCSQEDFYFQNSKAYQSEKNSNTGSMYHDIANTLQRGISISGIVNGFPQWANSARILLWS